MQSQNESIAIGTIVIVGGVVAFLVAIAVSAAIVTLVGTLPAMIVSGGDVVFSVGAVTIDLTAIASLLGSFFSATFLGVEVWVWVTIAALAITGIALWNANHPGQLQELLSGVITLAVSTGEAAIEELKEARKAINDAVYQTEKEMEEALAKIAVIDIAILLIWSHRGLSVAAAMILATAIAAKAVDLAAVNTALNQLCAGLLAGSDVANLVVDALQNGGESEAVLNQLIHYTEEANGSDTTAATGRSAY